MNTNTNNMNNTFFNLGALNAGTAKLTASMRDAFATMPQAKRDELRPALTEYAMFGGWLVMKGLDHMACANDANLRKMFAAEMQNDKDMRVKLQTKARGIWRDCQPEAHAKKLESNAKARAATKDYKPAKTANKTANKTDYKAAACDAISHLHSKAELQAVFDCLIKAMASAK